MKMVTTCLKQSSMKIDVPANHLVVTFPASNRWYETKEKKCMWHQEAPAGGSVSSIDEN